MNILYRFINDVTDSEVIQWITIQYNTIHYYNTIKGDTEAVQCTIQ